MKRTLNWNRLRWAGLLHADYLALHPLFRDAVNGQNMGKGYEKVNWWAQSSGSSYITGFMLTRSPRAMTGDFICYG